MEIDSENVKKRRKMEKKDTKEGDWIQTNTMSHHVSNNLLSWIPMAIGQVIRPSHWPNLNVSHHVSDNLLGYQWWLGKLFNPHTDPIPMCHTMWVTTCLVGDWASYSTLTLTRSQCVTPCEQRLGWLVIGQVIQLSHWPDPNASHSWAKIHIKCHDQLICSSRIAHQCSFASPITLGILEEQTLHTNGLQL